MEIALLQLDIAWENVPENHRRAARLLEAAATAGARLAVLPEMFSTGFSLDAGRLAQASGGESESFLQAEAKALDLFIVASIPEAGTPRPRNMALVVSPEGTVARYAKIHPFSYAGEHRHYEAGDRVVTVAIDGVRVTPLVCYDLRFPEPFRVAAAETDLFLVVANWPELRREHWRTLLRARAIENQAYVAGVNRVGDGDNQHYTGESAAIAPLGETLVEGGSEEGVLLASVDPGVVAKLRTRFPALDDRRPSAYKR
ncbi:MAG: nitrilase-related carbon-nitrogen hydrolase [Thermoanaerobaculia bacterium]